MDAGWLAALDPVADDIAETMRRVVDAGPYLPAQADVLKAFSYPFDEVRVLIVGQDPYPTPGHPIGLSFAVERHVRPIPRSLQNIYAELRSDLGVATPPHGDLTPWAEHGVMLLNRVLTVAPGAPASHRGMGWEKVTEHAIRALVGRGAPLAAILWGRDASTLKSILAAAPGGAVPWVESAHPSPLSASRGFFGSKPFSRVNAMLEAQGAAPVDWRLAS